MYHTITRLNFEKKKWREAPEKSVLGGRNHDFQSIIGHFLEKYWVSKKVWGFQKEYGVFEPKNKVWGF